MIGGLNPERSFLNRYVTVDIVEEECRFVLKSQMLITYCLSS